MSAFTDDELAVIRGAVLESNADKACDLLAERFTGARLVEACMLADAVNRGEVELRFTTGESFGRRLVSRVTEVTPPAVGGPA